MTAPPTSAGATRRAYRHREEHTMTTIAELIARWNSDEGKPHKGSLIDMEAYSADPDNIGCMCAQGQVLHLIGGWDAERLHRGKQSIADAETAKLLNISRAHAILLRKVNDSAGGAPSVVLTDPALVLGDQWSKLLDFWHCLDGMTDQQLSAARVAQCVATVPVAAWVAARDAALAARDAALAAAGDAAGVAARVAQCVATVPVAALASSEIQGADVMRRRGQSFFFLPRFGFDDPSQIPPRPDDYGIQMEQQQ